MENLGKLIFTNLTEYVSKASWSSNGVLSKTCVDNPDGSPAELDNRWLSIIYEILAKDCWISGRLDKEFSMDLNRCSLGFIIVINVSALACSVDKVSYKIQLRISNCSLISPIKLNIHFLEREHSWLHSDLITKFNTNPILQQKFRSESKQQ